MIFLLSKNVCKLKKQKQFWTEILHFPSLVSELSLFLLLMTCIFQIEEEIAAVALIRLARKYPGQITLVATGPLTNLALAARLDHEFPQLLHSVVIMGGNIYGK